MVFFFWTVTVTATLHVPVAVAMTRDRATWQTLPVRDVIETLPPLGTAMFNRCNTSDWRTEILKAMSLFAPVLKVGVVVGTELVGGEVVGVEGGAGSDCVSAMHDVDRTLGE